MRVLVLSNDSGGVYLFRKELLEELVRNKVEVIVSVPVNNSSKEIESIGCKVINNRYLDGRGTNILNEIKLIQYYRKFIKTAKPDVVLTYTIKPNAYGGYICGKQKVPFIANITGLGSAIENQGILGIISRVLYKQGLKHAYKVFFQNSENLKFMVKKKMLQTKCGLLPGSGVNVEKFKYGQYPSEDDTMHFLFMSRILTEKGIDQYMEAAVQIHSEYPNTLFHICGTYGDEEYRSKIQKCEESGSVKFHGRVLDTMSMYHMCSCTIHPTYYSEGMSNVLLESCACGRPIITTDRPGCREIVDDGINGFVVKERDSEDLIRIVRKFILLSKEERCNMGKRGRAKVEKYFDRRIVVGEYMEEIYAIENSMKNIRTQYVWNKRLY